MDKTIHHLDNESNHYQMDHHDRLETNRIMFHSYYDNIDGITFNYHLITFWIFNRCFDIIISFTPSFLIEYSISENIVTQWNIMSGGPRTIFCGCLFGWNVPKELYEEI